MRDQEIILVSSSGRWATESGYGVNFAAMSTWIKIRPHALHSLRGCAGRDDKDLQTVDVISRFYPRTQDEYLNPDVKSADDERPENARWERLLSIAEKTGDSRPCSPASMPTPWATRSAICEYWDEIYSNPRMLGGFIWEWADEGIFKRRDDGKMVAYGGDFGDYPNLKAFCVKGIVSSDRQPTPKYEEVKGDVTCAYRLPFQWRTVRVINHELHRPLCDYRYFGTSQSMASSRKKGELTLNANDEADIRN